MPVLLRGDVTPLAGAGRVREMIDCKDNPIMADSRDDIAGLEPVCAAVAMPGGVEGAGDGQCNELSAADMCDEETLASAGSASATEICSHPCALEMIDCIDSQNEVIAENRHIIEMLQTTCGSKQAECIPIIADLQGYFDETCCQGMDCSEGPPQTCSTGCGAYKQLFLRMLQDFPLNVGVSLQRRCFCRSGRTVAIRSTRWAPRPPTLRRSRRRWMVSTRYARHPTREREAAGIRSI